MYHKAQASYPSVSTMGYTISQHNWCKHFVRIYLRLSWCQLVQPCYQSSLCFVVFLSLSNGVKQQVSDIIEMSTYNWELFACNNIDWLVILWVTFLILQLRLYSYSHKFTIIHMTDLIIIEINLSSNLSYNSIGMKFVSFGFISWFDTRHHTLSFGSWRTQDYLFMIPTIHHFRFRMWFRLIVLFEYAYYNLSTLFLWFTTHQELINLF